MSQRVELDIYKIDIEAVIGAEREKLKNFSLYKRVIREIIDRKNDKEGLIYSKVEINVKAIGGYRLFLYEAQSTSESAIKRLLGQYFDAENNISYSYILFLCQNNEIYSLCSGSGWHIIHEYAEENFGLNLLSRLIPETDSAILYSTYSGIFGNIAKQNTEYRKNAKFSEVTGVTKLYREISAHIDFKEAQNKLGLAPRSKKKGLNANFKSTFRVKKALSIKEYCELLDKVRALKEESAMYDIEALIGISSLKNTARDKKLTERLDNELLNRLVKHSTKESIQVHMVVSDEFASVHSNTATYKIKNSKFEKEYNSFSNYKEFMEFYQDFIEVLGNDSENEEVLKNLLIETKVGVSDGEDYITKPLLECIQTDLVFDNRNYFKLANKWYKINDKYSDKLNMELQTLIENRKSSLCFPKWGKVDENTYLNKLVETEEHIKLHTKRPINNVELCDTIFYSEKENKLFLCHMKDNFDTNMRALCAQVRSSAMAIIDVRNSKSQYSKLKTALNKYKVYSRKVPWEVIQKALNKEIDIVQCIVFNPPKNLAVDIQKSRSTIAKMELITLITEWSYDMDIEMAVPEDKL